MFAIFQWISRNRAVNLYNKTVYTAGCVISGRYYFAMHSNACFCRKGICASLHRRSVTEADCNYVFTRIHLLWVAYTSHQFRFDGSLNPSSTRIKFEALIKSLLLFHVTTCSSTRANKNHSLLIFRHMIDDMLNVFKSGRIRALNVSIVTSLWTYLDNVVCVVFGRRHEANSHGNSILVVVITFCGHDTQTIILCDSIAPRDYRFFSIAGQRGPVL